MQTINIIYDYLSIKLGKHYKGNYQKGFDMDWPRPSLLATAEGRSLEAKRIQAATKCKPAIPYIDMGVCNRSYTYKF